MGDNATSTGTTSQTTLIYWKTVQGTNLDEFFNHRGNTSEIQVPFAPPTVKKTYLWNDENISGSSNNAGAHVIIHPLMSAQTPRESKKFASNTGQTYAENNEGYLRFAGAPTLHYYYGRSNAKTVDKVGKGAASDYYYLNMFIGGVQNRVPIGFCSPFQIQTYRNEINYHSQYPDSMDSLNTIKTTYLRGAYNVIGSGVTTNYSLTFGDSGLHDTLWSIFHQPKYDRFKNSEILEADMNMSEYDWNEMQLNRPILYNTEIYHIVSIQNYNPITRTASLRLIKLL